MHTLLHTHFLFPVPEDKFSPFVTFGWRQRDADHEIAAQRPRHVGGNCIHESAVHVHFAVDLHALEKWRHRGRREHGVRDPARTEHLFFPVRDLCRHRRKGQRKIGKTAFVQHGIDEVAHGKIGSCRQNGYRHALIIQPSQKLGYVPRGISLCIKRADDTADRRARHGGKMHAALFERLQGAYVRHSFCTAAAERESECLLLSEHNQINPSQMRARRKCPRRCRAPHG